MRAAAAVALSMLVLLAGGAARASAATHTVTYDHYSLSIDGQRTYVWSAEFHYWRLPSPDLWRDVLQKLKAGGFNAVSLYFDWAYHSPKPGVYDFSGGTRDIDRLLRMTEQEGLYVIARPGPYINAETDWAASRAGSTRWPGARAPTTPTSSPRATSGCTTSTRSSRRHQLTDGGGNVILYQVENEYGSNTSAAYMQHTEQTVRDDGITVPLTHNYCCGSATWATGPGAVDIPGQDSYPQGFNCSNPTQWSAPGTLPRFRDDAPIFSPEFQGGAFDPWGGPGYENCRRLTGPDFEKVFYKTNVAAGATLQSFYMTFGGTSWGWLPDPSQVYTSYDYGAAISEPRQLTTKYDELKRQGYFLTSTPSLLKTDAFAPDPPTSAAIAESGRVNPDDHAQFLLLRHADGRATSDDSTHVAIDLGAHAGYTYDDRDAALQYAGALGARRPGAELHGRRLHAHGVVLQRRGRLDDLRVHRHRRALDLGRGHQPRHRRRLPRRRQGRDGRRLQRVEGDPAGLLLGVRAGRRPAYAADRGDRHAAAGGDRRVRDRRRDRRAHAPARWLYPSVPQEPGTAITAQRARREDPCRSTSCSPASGSSTRRRS